VDTSEDRYTLKVLEVVLEKGGEEYLDRSCEKCSAQSQGGKERPTYGKTRKANWISHKLRMNCLLKHVTEGKILRRKYVRDAERMEKT
jgi:hypothetical protein